MLPAGAESSREAGLPEEWCQPLVTADHGLGPDDGRRPRVGFFSFIGSGDVGWMLRSQLAPGTRCSLEHGGVAPVIVAADADSDHALPLLVKGGFYHAGQVCVSVQRVFAERQIARHAGRAAGRGGREAEGGRSDAAGDRGRPADPRQRRSSAWTSGCRRRSAAGRELLCGGRALSADAATPPPCSTIRRPTPA